MVLLFRKACLLYKTSKMVFLRFIFTIFDMGIQGVTRGYRGLQGVTRGYRGLQGVTGGYKGLQGVTRGYRGLQRVTRACRALQGVTGGDKALQGVTKDYRNFFLERQQTQKMKKLQLFDENHGLSTLQKCQFCLLLKSMFILSRKACFLTRTSPNTFSRGILHKTKR